MEKPYECITSFRYGIEVGDRHELVRCGECENFIWNSISKNAGSCGIGIGNSPNYWHSKEWYCANGKRKDDENE